MTSIRDIENFDCQSGSIVERVIYNHRGVLVVLCLLVAAYMATAVWRLDVNASFQNMLPQSHEFIENYHTYADDLRALGNAVSVVVESENGSIYDARYLELLSQINDRVFLIPGVDRSFMESLWMASVRWTAVTEQGFDGGPVIPRGYDGSPESLEALRTNVHRADLVGSLVANDESSSMLFVPLLEHDPSTGEPLDYKAFTDELRSIKAEFEEQGVKLYTIGFAKLVGDLIQGLIEVLSYFLIAAAIVTCVVFWYAWCVRCTAIVISCSLIGVIWQLGIMQMLGFVLDPFSVLVPFLVFAIGVSHGAQMMNGIIHEIAKGTHRYIAARLTFRRLYWAGLAALLSDAAGFGVISVIDIPAIRDLALQASIGVAVLIVTNLLLIPVMLSYTGVSQRAADRAAKAASASEHPVSRFFARFTDPRTAVFVLSGTAVLTLGGWVIGQQLQVGDVDAGAPELRADSEYNRDVAYISEHYELSSDLFAIIVSTPEDGLNAFETLLDMDRLEQKLRDLPGVQTTESVASLARRFTPAGFEGSPKWLTISRNPFVTNDAVDNVFTARPGLLNHSRNVAPIIAYLTDHKAETLAAVVNVVEEFAKEHSSEDRRFMLAAGNAGFEAATNQTVAAANYKMLLLVYAAVIILCGVAFRSWRAVVVAVIPLAVISILAQAVMVMLGIGLKVATLPVIALGVGIGVDYALYLLTVYMAHIRQGLSVREAYLEALASTGKVVVLVGVTLTAAVGTWVFSPIKFQADMGLLLAFMFMGNMLAALVLIPSLATFLLRPGKGDNVANVSLESDDDDVAGASGITKPGVGRAG